MNEELSLLIFGGGINQLGLIREAKKIGITTIVIDPQPHPPGKDEADFFYQVSGSDFKTTKKIAKEYKVNGIITGQMERPLRLMAKLAKELNLIFNSLGTIEKCTDKWLMKRTFHENSVPCANGILLKSSKELFKKLPESLSFPLIIKPRDSFSSRGVYKINSMDELEFYFTETCGYSSTGDVIIEEFLEGKEFSVEAITYKGETTIIQYTEKFRTPYPNVVEMGHLQPANIANEQKRKIENLVKKAIISLEIDNTASHSEIMITS